MFSTCKEFFVFRHRSHRYEAFSIAASTRAARVGFRAMLGVCLLLFLSLAPAFAEQKPSWPPLAIAGNVVQPGEAKRFAVNVARSSRGQSHILDALVVVVRGTKPGPTLCLVAGIHGDEINGVEIAHRVYVGASPASLAGTLIAIPTANIQGIRSGTRYLPDRRDLNRAFPGDPNGSLASRIAYSLYDGVVRHCDALIDLHTGSSSRSNLPQIRTDLDSPRALALARSFGVGVVLHGSGPIGSLRRSVLDAGVPAVIYEAGEPLRFEEDKIARGVEGVRNVMAELGMVASTEKPRPSEVYRKTTWIRAGDATGAFLTSRKTGDYVRKGEALGTVTDLVDEATATIVATRDGRIIGMAVPQFVFPGFALFHLGYDPE